MRVQVKINFKEKDVASIYFDRSTLPVQVNVSNDQSVITGLSSGYNGFQLSSTNSKPMTLLNGNARLYPSTGYQGIITTEISGNNDDCNTVIPFMLTGNSPENLYINFDCVTGEHAISFSLTNSVTEHVIEVTDNASSSIVLPLSQFQLPATLDDATFVLTITKWSRANSSIKITRLSTYYTAVYTGNDLKSVINSENLMDAQMQITTGICEQYADISVYDRYDVLKKFALSNKLTPDHVLSISAIDDSNNVTHEMGNYIISNWIFDGTSSTVQIECKDRSYLFEKINIERSGISDRTLDELITVFFEQATGISWRYQDNETRSRCKAIVVPHSWYHASDLYTMLNKICALGMLRIYWYIDAFIVGRCA